MRNGIKIVLPQLRNETKRNPKVTKKLPIVNISNFEKTVKQIE